MPVDAMPHHPIGAPPGMWQAYHQGHHPAYMHQPPPHQYMPMPDFFDMPIRFSFPQEQTIGGQPFNSKQIIDAFLLERTPEAYSEVQRAHQLNLEGRNQDCIAQLAALQQSKRIHIEVVPGYQPVQ